MLNNASHCFMQNTGKENDVLNITYIQVHEVFNILDTLL